MTDHPLLPTIGATVYSLSRGREGQDELGEQVAPTGGTVVDVGVNGDGERLYLLLTRTFPRIETRWIDESDVDPFRSEPATIHGCRIAIRALCARVGYSKGSQARTGPFTPDEAEWVAWAYRLTGVLMSGEAR